MKNVTKSLLRKAFEAGKRQQAIQGNAWYPTKKESDKVFNDWFDKQFKKKK